MSFERDWQVLGYEDFKNFFVLSLVFQLLFDYVVIFRYLVFLIFGVSVGFNVWNWEMKL